MRHIVYILTYASEPVNEFSRLFCQNFNVLFGDFRLVAMSHVHKVTFRPSVWMTPSVRSRLSSRIMALRSVAM